MVNFNPNAVTTFSIVIARFELTGDVPERVKVHKPTLGQKEFWQSHVQFQLVRLPMDPVLSKTTWFNFTIYLVVVPLK